MTIADAISHLNYKPAEFLPGHVWLAGAGPGDPGCLTLDVLSALATADCIVYDALVSEAVLAAADHAELHFAGKRGGKPSTDQQDITQRLIGFARAGKRVVGLAGHRRQCGEILRARRFGDAHCGMVGRQACLELLDAYRTASTARVRQATLDAAVREAEIELEFASGWEIP